MMNKNSREVHNRNGGFSLIEVIVAIGVLAIVATPILSYFSQSSKYNANARMTQKAALANQKVVEDILSYKDVSDMAYHYVYTHQADDWKAVQAASPAAVEEHNVVNASTHAITGGKTRKYYFTRPVTVDGTKFKAVVTVDPTVYTGIGAKKAAANSSLPAGNPANISQIYYNDLAMPELKSIYTDQNIISVQSDEDSRGIELLSQNYDVGMDASTAKHIVEGGISTGVTYREIDVILSYATKTLAGSTVVDEDYITAKVVYNYYTRNASATYIKSTVDSVVDEYAVDDLKNIYIFYKNFCPTFAPNTNRPRQTDRITLKVDTPISGDLSHRQNLIDKINARPANEKLSIYMIMTRNQEPLMQMTDTTYEEYKPQFHAPDDADRLIAKDAKSTGKHMIVSNALAGVETSPSTLHATERDLVPYSGSVTGITQRHGGILWSEDNVLLADVQVDIYSDDGSLLYQTSNTGKGE